ncbi:MAG: hypothetical protein VKL98_01215 [Cyanobacteriota bacterium]|nr:hypothetical protein [Cyanobacteriota bacterium]
MTVVSQAPSPGSAAGRLGLRSLTEAALLYPPMEYLCHGLS